MLGGTGVSGNGVPWFGGGVLHAAMLGAMVVVGVVVLLMVSVAALLGFSSPSEWMLELMMGVRLVCSSCKSDVVHLLICC